MLNYHKTWRLINSGAYSASYNMALDEAIAISVRKNDSPPTLRLYSWDKQSVTLGCFQKLGDINIEYCRNRGIPIVRRPTGGRAILHKNELTYSFSVRTDNEIFSKGLLDSYKKISLAFNLAFRKIGVLAESKKVRERGEVLTRSPLCFQSSSFGEILIGNKKIVGSAQKRWPDGLLQQGSIPYVIKESEVANIFRLRPSQGKKEMIGLKDVVSDFSDERFRAAIRISFEETFNIEFISGLPSQDEEVHAMKLECEKYQVFQWNLRL
ncbi:MAG: lipoate--protein ligase family protein [Nitrospirae bacterium]|nr:lipoate--protein ligase family protein [Nitrospirota bacterium]